MKRFKRFYCIQCLRKYRRNDLAAGESCPFCLVPARGNTSKIVAQVVTRLRRLRGVEPPKRKTDYQLYLESGLWKEIRSRILERDQGVCQMCKAGAEVVHHKSYDREVLDGKRDSDLISLCKSCHESIEFTFNNGSRAKNSLGKANKKLHLAIGGLSEMASSII